MNEIMQPLIKTCEAKQKTTTTDQQKESFYSCWEEAQKQIEQTYSGDWVEEHINKKLAPFYDEVGSTRSFLLPFTLS
jgi:hypothetical protein